MEPLLKFQILMRFNWSWCLSTSEMLKLSAKLFVIWSCFACEAVGKLKAVMPSCLVNSVEAIQHILAAMNATSWRFNGDNCNLDAIIKIPKLTQEANASIGCDCNIGNDTNCHVVRITHKFYSLDGVLSPELVNLPYLRSFDVAYNYLQGSIPPEWGSSTRLQDISLIGNRITGEIPPELGNISTLTRL